MYNNNIQHYMGCHCRVYRGLAIYECYVNLGQSLTLVRLWYNAVAHDELHDPATCLYMVALAMHISYVL